ncbi:multidrug transporter [Streptococcus castoreus]|uniref:hypothetical protein n=1 Tax=Streptococcus castoreus TaxID=254786 RepID=UPI0003FAEE7D|nr:hypothetical protein [Streptococcus castoreus]
MIRPISILALLNLEDDLQYTFITELSSHFPHLFAIKMKDHRHTFNATDWTNYQAIFSFQQHSIDLPTLYFKCSEVGQGFTISKGLFDNAHEILELVQYITQFYQKFDGQFLHYLPLQARLANQDGQIIIDNHGFNGSFFPLTEKQIEPWILDDLKSGTSINKSFIVPSGSLDHIYMQHYHALKNNQGQVVGVFNTIQDIKPLLSQYLEETGQAIVGWSDVTSGPSITSDI